MSPKSKQTLPGQRIVRTYSIQNSLFEELGEFAEDVKSKTGINCDRSKLITIFAQMLKEIGNQVDIEKMENLDDLKMEIYKAIKKRKHA